MKRHAVERKKWKEKRWWERWRDEGKKKEGTWKRRKGGNEVRKEAVEVGVLGGGARGEGGENTSYER